MNLKLNLKEEKENDKRNDSEMLALLKRIEFLETKIDSKKKFQLILKPGNHGWKFKFEGNLELKFSSDVEFKVSCTLEHRSVYNYTQSFYLSCYNEDLNEHTYYSNLVYQTRQYASVEYCQAINFNFILGLIRAEIK